MFIEIVCAQSGTFVTWMCMTVCKYFYSPTYWGVTKSWRRDEIWTVILVRIWTLNSYLPVLTMIRPPAKPHLQILFCH